MGLLAVFLPRSCADQLAGMFTFIFNESLSTSVVSPLSIFVFIVTVYGPAHFILYLLFFTYIYVYSLVLVLHVIALSIERTDLTYISLSLSFILYLYLCIFSCVGVTCNCTVHWADLTWLTFHCWLILYNSSQVKLSFIVIPLHVWTYSGTRCRASQDHGAT